MRDRFDDQADQIVGGCDGNPTVNGVRLFEFCGVEVTPTVDGLRAFGAALLRQAYENARDYRAPCARAEVPVATSSTLEMAKEKSAHDFTAGEIEAAARATDDAMGLIYSQHSNTTGEWVLNPRMRSVVEKQWATTFLDKIGKIRGS